jgi:hypothetical protein
MMNSMQMEMKCRFLQERQEFCIVSLTLTLFVMLLLEMPCDVSNVLWTKCSVILVAIKFILIQAG